ncbi:hypothetical protein ACH42_09810 [Endozoicomonas sp. (ex Bugula neritina AB1)]|nr:hypothetical protein ACH42_09810 [Endozoicomonas sp. (ex Bugula neritina AB1)]
MNTSKITQPYSSAFEIAVSFVLAAEGGYVNDPEDTGGETSFGISKRAYPDLNIRALTLKHATAIYHEDYWLACGCQKMPAALACVVFDTAVNMGQVTAIQQLQKTLSVVVDGIVGPQTLTACYKTSPDNLIPDLLSRRAQRYHHIAQDSGQRFIRGWLKRTYELQQHLYEERLL